jgi:glycosyltransferase involved in cell wall biosynthesis
VKRKLLIIAHLWPESNTTAAGQHLLTLIQSFKNAKYQVHLGCTLDKTPLGDSLSEYDIQVHRIALNCNSFDELLLDLRPEVILFDRFISEEQFGWRVYKNLPQCLTLLNTEDLHSLRLSRSKGKEEEWETTDTFKREIASFYRVDKVLIISREEINKLTALLPSIGSKLIYAPLIIHRREITNHINRKSWSFVFFGSGKHPGNAATLQRIIEMWPNILKIQPESSLFIFGAYYPESLINKANKLKQVSFLGWVEDLDTILHNYQFLLSPTPFGAGLKGKVLQSINNGVICLCSSIASEGIDIESRSQWMHLNSEREYLNAIENTLINCGILENERSIQSELLHHFTDFSNDSWIADLTVESNSNASEILKQVMRHSTINSTENLGKYLTLKTNKN